MTHPTDDPILQAIRAEAFELPPEDRLALALALFESLEASIVEFEVTIPEPAPDPEPGEA